MILESLINHDDDDGNEMTKQKTKTLTYSTLLIWQIARLTGPYVVKH